MRQDATRPSIHYDWTGAGLEVVATSPVARVELVDPHGKVLGRAGFEENQLGFFVARLRPPASGTPLMGVILDEAGRRVAEVRLPPVQATNSTGETDAPANGRASWTRAASSRGEASDGRGFWQALRTRGKARLAKLRELPYYIRPLEAQLRTPPVKDEFETTAAWQARVEAYNARVRGFNEARAHFLATRPTSLPPEQWAIVASEALANDAPAPILTDFRYDADVGLVYLKTGPADFLKVLGLPSLLTARTDPEAARRLKGQLATLAPAWNFRITENGGLALADVRLEAEGLSIALAPADPDALARVTPLPQVRFEAVASGSVAAGSLPQIALPTAVAQNPQLRALAEELAALQRKQQETTASETARRQLESQITEARRKLADMPASGAGPDDLPDRLAKAPAVPANPHRYMLAVGIADYRSLPAVPFADAATRAMAEAGKRLLGVPEANMTVLTNDRATQGAFKGALRRTLARLGPDDTLYLYYAGHGAPSRDGQSAYLMPQDADDATFEEDDLRMSAVLERLAGSKAGRIVVFVDACFSGRSGPKSLLFKGVAPVMVTPTSQVTDPDRMTLFTASEGNQFANEFRARGERLFTWHLLDALLSGVRDIGPLATRIREGVGSASRELGPTYEQTPKVQGRVKGGI
jgi:hypothetical protein